MHAHDFIPDEGHLGWEVCRICGTAHNLNHVSRDHYLQNYWDGKVHSTLEQQRYNLEVIENENGESKVRAALKHCLPGSILEVACAPGSLLRIAQEEGWEVEGCEPDHKYAAQISEHADCPIRAGFFEDIDFERTYTNLVALDLLEHLDDPVKFIENALSWVEDGGRIILMIPTIESARPCDWETPEHIWLFSESYIREWLNPLIIETWLSGHSIIVIEK
jgi:2-polyprenyl-3-methyl-5-hydroxy-6-metoxy-1,4-benzoquinol methylase